MEKKKKKLFLIPDAAQGGKRGGRVDRREKENPYLNCLSQKRRRSLARKALSFGDPMRGKRRKRKGRIFEVKKEGNGKKVAIPILFPHSRRRKGKDFLRR